MSVEETREKVKMALFFWGEVPASVMEDIDAYALAAHVDTCQARDCTPGYGAPSHACGEDGWYCEDARQYMGASS